MRARVNKSQKQNETKQSMKNKEKILCKQDSWLQNDNQYNKEDLR